MSAILLATGATATTAYDWSTVNLTPITDALNNVSTVAMPVVITVAAFFVGVSILKKLIRKAQG